MCTPSWIAAVVSLTLAAGVARAEAPFAPAESVVYEGRYLGITIGRVVATIGAATEMQGHQVWPVIAMAKTDAQYLFWPVKNRYVMWWDPAAHQSLGCEYLVDENHKRRRERIRFDWKAKTSTFVCEKEDVPLYQETLPTDPATRDTLAALYTLRERPLAVGDHEEVPVYTGKTPFLLKADVEGKQKMEVPAGEFETVVVRLQVGFTGKAAARSARIYFSDDARHVPVRMEGEFLFGTVLLDLISYEKGLPLP